MKIISWNCYRGEIEAKVKELSLFSPDIVCLQECRGAANGRVVSSQRNPQQGIAIWARDGYSIIESTMAEEAPHHVKVSIEKQERGDKLSFDMIGIWTHPEPSYTKSLRAVLEANAKAVRDRPTIVLGDFNSSATLNNNKTSYTHNDLVQDFAALGLVSAYHTYHGCEHGQEPDATYYWRWKQTSPFHLDYCFLPKAWADKITSVVVPDFVQFRNSDHRPLIVEIAF